MGCDYCFYKLHLVYQIDTCIEDPSIDARFSGVYYYKLKKLISYDIGFTYDRNNDIYKEEEYKKYSKSEIKISDEMMEEIKKELEEKYKEYNIIFDIKNLYFMHTYGVC